MLSREAREILLVEVDAAVGEFSEGSLLLELCEEVISAYVLRKTDPL